MSCPICKTKFEDNHCSFIKNRILYMICYRCFSFYHRSSPMLDTCNDSSINRNNDPAHQVRLNRMKDFKGDFGCLVDFGCGNGEFVDFATRSVIPMVFGIDKDTHIQLKDIQSESVDVVNLVEVIEHLHDNIHGIFEEFHRILRPNGIIYIESTFTDSIPNPHIHSYVDPNIDHSCILSYTALRILAKQFGVVQLNPHVFILQKL